jgi:hypothetical protein
MINHVCLPVFGLYELILRQKKRAVKALVVILFSIQNQNSSHPSTPHDTIPIEAVVTTTPTPQKKLDKTDRINSLLPLM